MKLHGRNALFLLGLTLALGRLCAAEPAHMPPMPAPAGVKLNTLPPRKPVNPEERGKPYPPPPTGWSTAPVIWGWSCEIPDGSGLAFGGVNQINETGRGHTALKNGNDWPVIVDELRKSNPLQKHFDSAMALRNACKDTLARARTIYFEGQPAAEEAKHLGEQVNPILDKLNKDMAALNTALKGESSLCAYENGQAQIALKYIEAAAGLIKPAPAQTTPQYLATLRKGQIALERAAEALDAEPPPRTLSLLAWDPKTKLYVVFGGDHTDYITNDLWVFDPAKKRWFQKHQESAPEPRADHFFEALGDGRIALSGGYTLKDGYKHIGPARWLYDIEKNTWTADGHQEKGVPSSSRAGGYDVPAAPENFMQGPRPDAAAFSTQLTDLPANTWVQLKTQVPLGGRDWGTWVYDSDRDMLYVYAGGHASYGGNDVARYHLSTGRWEISDPLERPLGGWGTNEQFPSGFNFNRRPWCKPHVWNGQCYDPSLKQMIMGSVTDQKLDPYSYFYDPDKADFVGRKRVAEGMPNGAYGMQIRATKHGVVAWNGPFLFDSKSMEWKKLAVKGTMPGGGVDSSGMVYDSKRDRMLFVTLGGYAKPYDGQVHALDMATNQVTPLNPEGLKPAWNWNMFLREVAYHPDSDMFLWVSHLNANGKEISDLFPAYDAAKNRWVTVKIATQKGAPPFNSGYAPVCTSIHWDAKRNLFWIGDSSWNGGVWVMKFDPASAEIKPLKDFQPPPPPEPKK
ncbi:MAG: hypothetical protein HY291_22605 [Planctomycetes bacterium]|nr:hypothetical protein [Planctomycetota bacterium]